MSATPPALLGTRAAWVWDFRDPQGIIRAASHLRLRELFVSVPAEPAPDLPVLRQLALLAARRGITLAALGSATEWVLDHAAARRWRDRVLASRLFPRVHLDVEPHVEHDWPGGITWPDRRLVRGYLTLLDQFPSNRLEVDVPFWWETVPGLTRPSLADEVLARSRVTVMAYRTDPDAIIAVARDVLNRADALHTRLRPRYVRVGVSAAPVPGCPDCGFTAPDVLERALDDVVALAGTHASFAGTAVHDLTHWAALSPPLAPAFGAMGVLPEFGPAWSPAPPDWNASPVDWTAPRSATWT